MSPHTSRVGRRPGVAGTIVRRTDDAHAADRLLSNQGRGVPGSIRQCRIVREPCEHRDVVAPRREMLGRPAVYGPMPVSSGR